MSDTVIVIVVETPASKPDGAYTINRSIQEEAISWRQDCGLALAAMADGAALPESKVEAPVIVRQINSISLPIAVTGHCFDRLAATGQDRPLMLGRGVVCAKLK
jgi:hypothetical protein